MTSEYIGKYRGTVVNNIDPMQQGRIQVIVPDVSGVALSSWAMPCLPSIGLQSGIFTVPPLGAGVWVEFEHGDPDYPIWTGCFPGSTADIPVLALTSPPPLSAITLQTQLLQNGIIISDSPAIGITLRTGSGAMITINETGIMISNGRGAVITLNGPVVNINGGALTIT